MPRTVNGHKFETFADDFANPNFMTPVEKALIELKTDIFGAFLDVQEREGLTQEEWAQKLHITNSEIEKIKKPETNRQIVALLKATAPFGYRVKLERV